MFKEVLPNCLAPLIVQATLGISTAILDAAALGFLGLGAQPPVPEWGTMLADAREFVLRAWWVVTFPGLTILITVLAFNLLGDGLRDALDPRLKRCHAAARHQKPQRRFSLRRRRAARGRRRDVGDRAGRRARHRRRVRLGQERRDDGDDGPGAVSRPGQRRRACRSKGAICSLCPSASGARSSARTSR